MKNIIGEDIYKAIDRERIRKALDNGNRKDALTLFKYSSLTSDEFLEIEQKEPTTNPIEDAVSEKSHWEQILELIAEQISKPSFDTWVKSTKGQFTDETLVVHTSNEFQRDWLETQYQDLFTSVTKTVTGKSFQVVFLCEDQDINSLIG